ncbi:MAG: D-2-hydroxyacid dehydrogenase [Sciscionella sp.]
MMRDPNDNNHALQPSTTQVLVLDWRPNEFTETLERFPHVTFHVTTSLDEARPHLDTADVLVTVGHDVTSQVIGQMPALRWMHSLISGTNWATAALEHRPDVLLTSTRGIHGQRMAEAALCHMLCLAREVPRSVRNQDRRRWERWDSVLLAGKTVAIVGMGVIGEQLARTCSALGMTVLGVSRTQRPVEGVADIFARDELPLVAAQADFLVLTVPLSADTQHLIDSRVLQAMKPTAYLVNLARGAVIDTAALLAALHDGTIAGAGLDVFDPEPLPADSPLWGLDNVFMTAHIGGRSDGYIADAMLIFEPNLRLWLDGDHASLLNPVER